VAPDRDAPQMRWASLGAVVATVLWVIASVGFSLYANNLGTYGKTYGALAGVVVLMLWLYWSAYIILLGAEVNAEAEQQTAKDTTTGAPQPLGERHAVKADTVAGDAGER
jgi:membrane protein